MKNLEIESGRASAVGSSHGARASLPAPSTRDLSSASEPRRRAAGGRSDSPSSPATHATNATERPPTRIPTARPGRELADFTRIRHALRNGQLVDDRVFDEIYPLSVRRASSVHWTPVEVAAAAAKLLAPKPGAVVLDVGAGVGKFCIVAAAAVDAVVKGVEHRPHFVEVGRAAAAKVGVDIHLLRGTLADVDPAGVDGIYLFNPFAENLCTRQDYLDDTVELSEERFWRDVGHMQEFMSQARPGMRVVTYCGWGGGMPDDYVLADRRRRAGIIELWIKVDGYSRVREADEDPVRVGPTSVRALRDRVLAEEQGRAVADLPRQIVG